MYSARAKKPKFPKQKQKRRSTKRKVIGIPPPLKKMPQTREAPILRYRNKYHLPYDIVLNILTRLPVKSVMRLRCVSKSLDSLITSPHFISTHLNNINNKDDDDDHDRYLIHMPASSPPTRSINRSICTVALDRTFDAISEVRIPSDFSSNVDDIVGSCNGLLCLVDYTNNIYLWNPSVRKFKKLPHTCLKNLNNATLGFAYHSQNNDYKVVRIAYASWMPALPLPPSEIEVYTLSSDSWRRVGIDFTTNGLFFTKNHLLTTPLVSGALHWMAVEEIHSCVMIISFDVNSEEFRKLAQPHGSIDDNNINRCLASFKGKLAFITCGHSEQLGSQHSIWVMREYGVVESWNKLFVLPLETPSFCVAFTEYGSLLIFMDLSTAVENYEFQFLLIDTETRQEKRDPDIQCVSTVVAFMESLVLLDGANVVSY